MRRALVLVGLLVLMAAVAYGATRLAVRSARVQPPTCQALATLEDYLAVTPDQREVMSGIDAKYAAIRPGLRDRVWQTRDELIATLKDPSSTREQAVEKAKEFSEAQEAMQTNTVEYVMELRQHLTPAQKQKLTGLLGRGMCALTGGQCRRGMGTGMGPGMGGGMGPGMGAGIGGRGRGYCGGRGSRGVRP